MNSIISFVIDHKEDIGSAVVLLWEIAVRIKPTWKDWSLVNAAKRVFDLIPNRTKSGGTH